MMEGTEVARIICEVPDCTSPATVFTSECARVAGAPFRWETRYCGAHARPARELAEVGTFAHDGREFSAMGATITDGRAVVYVGALLNPYYPDGRELALGYGRLPSWHRARYAATTWTGEVIGELAEVSSWRVPGGYTSGWVHAYQLTLPDGRRYAVRGSGAGMVASGRRMLPERPRRP